MSHQKNRDHTFTCPNCNQQITAGIITDEDIPSAEQFHITECRMGNVHRMVTFDVSLARRGEAACGNQSEQRRSTMPSNVTCEECIARIPGMQLRGMLETLTDPQNSQRVEAPQQVRNALAQIRRMLQQQQD